MLQKDASWYCSPACDIAYKTLKAAITSNSTLVHYNTALSLVLECDASSYGVGAAIHHIMPDGSKRPIVFASTSLSTSEKQYSQIETCYNICRQTVQSIFIWPIFHFGNRPQATINGCRAKGHITSVFAYRLDRWAVILSAYDFTLEFRLTKQHANADYLSRNPLSITVDECLIGDDLSSTVYISFIDDLSDPH